MITFLFLILMFGVFGKIAWWGIKATWGLTKLIFGIVLMPVILIVMFISGAVAIVLPVLVILGIIALLAPAFE